MPEGGNRLKPLSFWIPAFAGYVFSRCLSFETIPKACGFDAATLSPSILLCGSLIPIVVICLRHAQGGDGDGSSLAKHMPPAKNSQILNS